MEKKLYKVWRDPITVPAEVECMAKEYQEQGYTCRTIPGGLILHLDDGIVGIYWQDGAFYQTIQSQAEVLNKLFEG